MKAEISKIVITLGSKDIELTNEEAKKLFDALEELFGSKITYIDRHYPIYLDRYPSYPYWKPYWVGNTLGQSDNALGKPYKHIETWCSDSGNLTASFDNLSSTLALDIT